MRGEAHVTDPPIGLPAPDNIHAARRPERLLQMFRQVDAMDGQEIESLAVEPLESQLELRLKISGIGAGRHLALKQTMVIATSRQGPAKLPLGTAVMTRGFDMMKTPVNGSLERCLQIDLRFSGDLPGGEVGPTLLEAHPPQGEQRNLQFCSAESARG